MCRKMHDWRDNQRRTAKKQKEKEATRWKYEWLREEKTQQRSNGKMVFVLLLIFHFMTFDTNNSINYCTNCPEFSFKRFYCLNYNKVLMCTHIRACTEPRLVCACCEHRYISRITMEMGIYARARATHSVDVAISRRVHLILWINKMRHHEYIIHLVWTR